jgi:hypothetical protein
MLIGVSELPLRSRQVQLLGAPIGRQGPTPNDIQRQRGQISKTLAETGAGGGFLGLAG